MIFFIQHMRANVILAVCILIIIAGTLFLFIQPTPTPQSLTDHTDPLPNTSLQEIQIQTIYSLAETDPDQALNTLKQFIQDEPTYMIQCHEIAHEIGHIAYGHFDEEAFTFKKPMCGGGYLHGLLEEATIFDESMSLTEIVHTVCTGDIEESCLHGLGHAIYKSVQTVPDSIKYCDQIINKNKDCYDGVFMEIFDLEENSSEIPIRESLNICLTATAETKHSCMFYLPRALKKEEPGIVVTFCANLTEESDQLICAEGSGVMFMKYAPLFKIEEVIPKCAFYTKEVLKQACAEGANSYYTYGNVTNTEW
jgi:hypothetical protein